MIFDAILARCGAHTMLDTSRQCLPCLHSEEYSFSHTSLRCRYYMHVMHIAHHTIKLATNQTLHVFHLFAEEEKLRTEFIVQPCIYTYTLMKRGTAGLWPHGLIIGSAAR